MNVNYEMYDIIYIDGSHHHDDVGSVGCSMDGHHCLHPEGQQKIKHGWYRSYYPDGTPQSTGAYRGRGKISAGEKRYGRWVYFDIHGRDSDEDIWRNGECVERCEGDEI